MRNLPVVENGGSKDDLFSRLLKDRIIILSDEVDDQQSELIMSQLLYLDAEDHDKDITMYINSPGGSVTSGLMIYDTMQLIKSDVSTVCIGHAASMGAFILAGGTKGKRRITQNAEVMIHQPSGGSRGQETEMRINYEHIQRTRNTLEKMLAEFSGQPINIIHADCERDYWMTAEEAVEYGLVDEIIIKEN